MHIGKGKGTYCTFLVDNVHLCVFLMYLLIHSCTVGASTAGSLSIGPCDSIRELMAEGWGGDRERWPILLVPSCCSVLKVRFYG